MQLDDAKHNRGTHFQDVFQEALKEMAVHLPCLWHRLADTKAARNYVREQPGDFMLLAGVAHLFELKSSDSGRTLKQMLNTQGGRRQVAQARKWLRAGGMAWFLYLNEQTGMVQAWPAALVITGEFGGVPWRVCRLEGLDWLLGEIMSEGKDAV